MSVYFLQAASGGPIKIGCSQDVEARRRELEYYYGQQLTVLSVIEGDRKTEREIHRRFAASRIGRTEQFRPTADLMAFVGLPLLVHPNPDAVEAMKPTRENGHFIRLELDDEQHAKLRVLAAQSGLSMAAYVRAIVGQVISDAERKEERRKGKGT